jgi:amino-acid N-acetyltransferase
MRIVPASPAAFESAIRLLQQNTLPVDDISSGTQLFVMEEDGEVIGTIAVEYDFSNALLRSLSVDGNRRQAGIGQQLVSFIENYVKQQGVETIYLLTTTAADFFSKRGYQKIERSDVPSFIQQTSEFGSVCPSSATVMKKTL